MPINVRMIEIDGSKVSWTKSCYQWDLNLQPPTPESEVLGTGPLTLIIEQGFWKCL